MSRIPRGEDERAKVLYLEATHQVNGRWVYKPLPSNQNPTADDLAGIFTQFLGFPVTAGNIRGLAKLTKRTNKRVPAKPKGPKNLISLQDVMAAISKLAADVQETRQLLDTRVYHIGHFPREPEARPNGAIPE